MKGNNGFVYINYLYYLCDSDKYQAVCKKE